MQPMKLFFALQFLFLWTSVTGSAVAAEKVNLVFIMADDLGYDYVPADKMIAG